MLHGKKVASALHHTSAASGFLILSLARPAAGCTSCTRRCRRARLRSSTPRSGRARCREASPPGKTQPQQVHKGMLLLAKMTSALSGRLIAILCNSDTSSQNQKQTIGISLINISEIVGNSETNQSNIWRNASNHLFPVVKFDELALTFEKTRCIRP